MRGPWGRAGLLYGALTLAVTFPVAPRSVVLTIWATRSSARAPVVERTCCRSPSDGERLRSSFPRRAQSRSQITVWGKPSGLPQWLGFSPSRHNAHVPGDVSALRAFRSCPWRSRSQTPRPLLRLAYGFNPYRVAHASHLELLAAFGMHWLPLRRSICSERPPGQMDRRLPRAVRSRTEFELLPAVFRSARHLDPWFVRRRN